MLAAFLPSYPFRGTTAPYLWCYYRLIAQWANESAFFITGRDYVRPVDEWQDRWECEPVMQQRLGYILPDNTTPEQHCYGWLNEARFDDWLAQVGGNPLAAFERFLTKRDPKFEQELHTLLASASKPIEAVLTPCNVPSLAAVCSELGIAVIHFELGALRGPLYYETGYIDFSGVNGNTESDARYKQFNGGNVERVNGKSAGWQLPLSCDDLHRFFITSLTERTGLSARSEYDVGVVLQVEDDSNLLAFANGMNNLSLITLAQQQSESVLVRPHPGSRFALRQGALALDDSCHSLSFISRCRRIITINSSVGLEAMLLGKPVQVLGDNAFNFILAAEQPAEHIRRLAFYLFGYLVPFSLQLCPDYLRFRLSQPNEEDIILRHLSEYMKQQDLKTDLFETLPAAEQITASVVFANQQQQHQEQLEQQQQLLEQQTQKLAQLNAQFQANQQALLAVEQLRDSMLQSGSWRVTRPLRVAARLLRGDTKALGDRWQVWSQGTGRVGSMLRKGQTAGRLVVLLCRQPSLALKGIKHVRQSGVRHTINRLREVSVPRSHYFDDTPLALDGRGVVILTTAHCHYLARHIQNALSKVDVNATIIHQMPAQGFSDVLHFVICPQMFKRLPSLYVAYQMEQSVSSRWFTPEYFNVLEHAYAVFDYSLRNIEFLQAEGLSYKQLYYLPVGYLAPAELPQRHETVDVLFYGDINNERRKAYITALQQEFSVKVVSNLFGEALYAEMAKAKVVVNIHYYEGALLETTRLYECLSQQQIVVSEEGSDMEEHTELRDLVDFVAVNDITAMVKRVRYWVKHDEERADRRVRQLELNEQSPNWFEFYFLRFLLASELISYEQFYEIAARHIHFNSDFVCLGLPETVERRADFDKDNQYGIEYFPGLRHRLGWIGCGLSYKFLLQRAQDLALPRITICEDDVEFYANFAERYSRVLAYLDSQEDWDVFAGLIAQLHEELTILGCEQVDGERYLTINKMVSMVMNVYSSRFYSKLQAWDSTNHDAETNTIDRFIEQHEQVQAVTTPHFLVGHKEELDSTLWGFNNQTYSQMIADSEVKLKQKLADYNNTTQPEHAAG